MIPPIDPEHTRIDHYGMAVRAMQQYQLKQGVRQAELRRRAERTASKRSSRRRHFRLIPAHVSRPS